VELVGTKLVDIEREAIRPLPTTQGTGKIPQIFQE
jgi:hypothetical protein